jgi:hypothetical protein
MVPWGPFGIPDPTSFLLNLWPVARSGDLFCQIAAHGI